jgi:MFS family permease
MKMAKLAEKHSSASSHEPEDEPVQAASEWRLVLMVAALVETDPAVVQGPYSPSVAACFASSAVAGSSMPSGASSILCDSSTPGPICIRHQLDRIPWVIPAIFVCCSCRLVGRQVWPKGRYCSKIANRRLTSGVAQLPLYVGSIVTVVAIFIASLCDKYYQLFLAQGTLLGIGMAFVLLPSAATVPKYFGKHRGLALGIVVSGSSLGGAIWPIMLEQLLEVHRLSFGWTMRIVGFTMLAILPIACVLLRPPKKAATTGPGSNTEESKESKAYKMDLSVAKDWTGLTICYFGFFTPFFFVTSYSTSLGHSSISFYLVSILNGASSFGRIIPGYLADRAGVFNTLILFGLFAGVTALSWTAAKSVAGLVVWSAAYGFSSGVSSVGNSSGWHELT